MSHLDLHVYTLLAALYMYISDGCVLCPRGVGQLLCRSGPHTIRIGLTVMHGPISAKIQIIEHAAVACHLELCIIMQSSILIYTNLDLLYTV